MADQLYQAATLRETYRWTGTLDGDTPDDLGPNLVVILDRLYLRCTGGELVDLAHVESFTPIT